MQRTYFRVQDGNRNPRDLLAPGQTSHYWGRDDRNRSGVSVCDSRETLATYLAGAGAGIPYGEGGWVLVELAGEISNDRPIDAADGELLIHPTEIISVGEIDDGFFNLIGEAYDNATA